MVSTMGTTTTPRTGYGDLQRLMALIPGDPKHPVGDTSTLDVIWTLYGTPEEHDAVHGLDPIGLRSAVVEFTSAA